jgi:hypothetical protein
MSYVSLLARLAKFKHQPKQLASEIHNCWVRCRWRNGWRFGPSNLSRKTSSYLKPLSEFSGIEYDREIFLSLVDLNGMIKVIGQFDALNDRRETQSRDLVVQLSQLKDSSQFIQETSVVVHEGWRKVNLALGTGIGDHRLSLPYSSLSPAEKRITRANAQANVEAVSNLIGLK